MNHEAANPLNEAELTASRIRWGVLAALYVCFLLWYGGSGEPVSPEEVEGYVAAFEERAAARGPSGVGQETDDLEILGNIREFLETDDGQEFVMLNLNVYREAPEYPESVDITEAIETAAEAEDEYQRRVAPLLFARAAHPIVGVEPVFLLGGIGHFERQNWNFASMVRYRSRRDFIQMILSPAFSQDVNLKWAALARSTSMISVPVISLAMIRVIPLLILIIIGLVLDRITVRSS